MTWRKFWFILFLGVSFAIIFFNRTNSWWLIPLLFVFGAMTIADWRVEHRRQDKEQARRIIDRENP